MAKKTVFATQIIDVVGPSAEFVDIVSDGGTIIAGSNPACFSPMITPEVRSGHEVTAPIEVEGASVGDAVALKVKKIEVLSKATASGTETPVEGRFLGDPFAAKQCPGCGTMWPDSYVDLETHTIRCKKCNAEVNPFQFTCGYTMVFSPDYTVGITVDEKSAHEIAEKADEFTIAGVEGKSHPVTSLAVADLVGVIARVRPMLGNFGTSPAVDMPSSHNAGDFGAFLVGAPHPLAISQEDLTTKRSDAHMDVDSVGAGMMVIAPVMIDGAGITVGDVHAMQGDGEIAGHTTDVAARTTIDVEVIKGLKLDGPILIPRYEDIQFLAKRYTDKELAAARALAKEYGVEIKEDLLPIQMVGSGPNLTDATQNGLERLVNFTGLDFEEIRNRVTITGTIEIGRLPGVVHISMLTPTEILEEKGILHLVKEQYGI